MHHKTEFDPRAPPPQTQTMKEEPLVNNIWENKVNFAEFSHKLDQHCGIYEEVCECPLFILACYRLYRERYGDMHALG